LAFDRTTRPPPPPQETGRANLETDVAFEARLRRDRKPAGGAGYPFRELVELRMTVDRTSSDDHHRCAGDRLVESVADDAARGRRTAAESLLRGAMSHEPRIVGLRDILISGVCRQRADDERQHAETTEEMSTDHCVAPPDHETTSIVRGA